MVVATKKDFIECSRCGTCCIAGPCAQGKLAEDGVCSELVIHPDYTTSCGLVAKGQTPSFLKKRTGCFLRRCEEIFKFYYEDHGVPERKKLLAKKRGTHETFQDLLVGQDD